MLDDAHYWAATQFGSADLGDARRTGRLVSTMAAIARAPDESLPRQLGSIAGAKAAYRLFDCGAVTREAVMDPHLAQCRAEAARHPIVLMVHDDTTLDFSTHRRLQGAGRVGDDHGTGFLAHSCLAVLPSGETLGLAHQTIWARPPKGVTRPDPRVSGLGRNGRDDRPSAGGQPLRFGRRTVVPTSSSIWRVSGIPAGTRSCGRPRIDDWLPGGGSLTALRAARAMGAATVLTRQGEAVVCVAWRELELLPPRNGPAGRAPIRVSGVRVWNDTLEWLLLTTRPVESLDQALEIIAWYARRWTVEEFHKAWKTGCRAEQRQLEEADRLVPLLGALAIVAVRLLGLRDAARRDGAAPADVPETTIRILAAKLQQPAECFTTNRDFLRGVARLGGFLARKSDGEPGWQTIWKGWFVLMILVEGYELAQAITSPK